LSGGDGVVCCWGKRFVEDANGIQLLGRKKIFPGKKKCRKGKGELKKSRKGWEYRRFMMYLFLESTLVWVVF
jgi:hypothetical protein